MRFSSLGAAFALIVIASEGVDAQGFGRAANQPYNAGVAVINPPSVMPMNLMIQFKDAWRRKRPQMTDAALAWLRERDIGGGFRMSTNRLNIADDGRLYVGADSRGFTVRFLLANNVLTTYLRNPTRVSGEALFVTTFDIDITIDVNVSGNQLVPGPARIQTTVRRPNGESTLGAFAVVPDAIVRVLSSPGFTAALLSKLNAGEFSPPAEITNTLSQVNPLFRRASSVTTGYDASSGNLTVTLRRTP